MSHALAGTPASETGTLARLNTVERRVLTLLAEGHTAKSIATATGMSVHAVNERLREARRKTGLGSSREVARLLRTQENRDEPIEMAPAVATPDPGSRPADSIVGRGGHRSEKSVMFLAAIALGAAALVAIQQVPVVPAAADSQEALAYGLAHESVDPDWAMQTAHGLESLYAPIAGVGPVTVRCGSSLWVVEGMIAPDMAPSAMQILQGPDLHRRAATTGVRTEALIRFDSNPAQRRRDDFVRFVSYWRR